VEKYGTATQATRGNIKWRMRFVRWINKTTDTHSECVTLIAFPRLQLLHQRVSVLGYSYTVCLAKILPTFFFLFFHRASLKQFLLQCPTNALYYKL
jgi:hypothetical protein